MVQSAHALGPKRTLIAALVPVILCGSMLFAAYHAPLAYADPVAEKQAEANAALQSLNTMLTELDEANEAYAAAVGEQEQAKKRMAEIERQIVRQNEKIDALQQQLGGRARSMYRTGIASFLDVLFGATSFTNFATNWDLLTDLTAGDAQLVADMKEQRRQLAQMQMSYEEQKRAADKAAANAQAIRDQANETAQHMQETYDALSAEAAELLAAQQAALAAEAQARALAEAQEAAGVANTVVDGAAVEAVQYAAEQAQVYNDPQAVADAGQAISMDEITSFDEATGTATLSDGSTTRVVGYDANTGNAIVDLAAQFVGGNYGWGAEDPTTSTFDCSGLVQYVYAQNGIEVGGHNDRAILNAGTVVDTPEQGDILWWDGHVAIYAGDGMMISADNEQYGITYREVSPGATYVRY